MNEDRGVVVLFDIDGTLVTCGGAGRRAMERALAEHASERAVTDFGFGGMTDRAIVREALRRAELSADEERIDAILERYLAHLEEELPRSEGYAILEGVEAVLDVLEAEQASGRALAIGLGTGNLVRGAELKLTRGGLWSRFAFGGYGSDHEDRATLLAHGAERGRAWLESSEARVVVIGDTPRDVSAAHAIGARCIAVASGTYDHATLAALAPHRALVSLADLLLEDILSDERA